MSPLLGYSSHLHLSVSEPIRKLLQGLAANSSNRLLLWELLLAEQELPVEDSYDGYLQLENGVGMLRLLKEEFTQALIERKSSEGQQEDVEDKQSQTIAERKITVATGLLAAPTLKELMEDFRKAFSSFVFNAFHTQNEFFVFV